MYIVQELGSIDMLDKNQIIMIKIYIKKAKERNENNNYYCKVHYVTTLYNLFGIIHKYIILDL